MRWLVSLIALLFLAAPAEAQWYFGEGAPPVGGGETFTFVGSFSGSDDASDPNVSAGPAGFNIQSGDLVLVAVTGEDNPTAQVAVSDGTNTYTFTTGDDVHDPTNGVNLHPLYKINAAAVTTPTLTASFTSDGSTPVNVPFKKMTVVVFRPSGGTVTRDISGTRENSSGSDGSTLTTGTFSTTGSSNVVCGLGGIYTSGSWTTPTTVAGVAAAHKSEPSGITIWCDIAEGPITTQTAVTNYTASRNWAATVLSFKVE